MRRRSRGQRGVSGAIVAVLVSLVLLVSAAFAVDLGMQRVVRRDMQAVADVVALDLARLLNGGKVSDYSTSSFDTARDESVARNSSAAGDVLDPGDVDWDFVVRNGNDWTVTDDPAAVPEAVQVTASSGVGFAFGGITGVERGEVVRTAVATAVETACFRIGSFIASLDSAQSALLDPLLSALLGSVVNLDLVSYKGLANVNVSLLELVEVGGLGVGTVDELLELQDVSVGGLFVAAAKVLDRQGNGAQADVLRAITVSTGTPAIGIADLIHADGSSSAALGASLNVLDLVTGSAMVANADHAVAVPDLGVDLPGVTGTSATLTVVEAPRTRCGPKGTTNETAQVRLTLTATIPARRIPVSFLGVADVDVLLDATRIVLDVDLGQAVGVLSGVTCGPSGPRSIEVALASGVVGSIDLQARVGAHAAITVPLSGSGGLLSEVLSVLGLGSLLTAPEIRLNTGLTARAGAPAGTTYTKDVTLPIPESYTVPTGTGSGVLINPLDTQATGTTTMTIQHGPFAGQTTTVHTADPLYDTVLGAVRSAVTSTLNPLVTTLQNDLVSPLAELLGVQLGGADVFAALGPPTCSGPRLVG